MKTIMVAPLNWGLGHATRCIPIIHALKEQNFKVLIASDGAALTLLQKEFPDIESIELPSYRVRYPSHGFFFKWKMLFSLPRIYKTMIAEHKLTAKLVSEGKIDGIISDSRFGARNIKVPSAYITHQLNVKTGSTTFLSSKMHQKIIKKFDVCWVPDVKAPVTNLSGRLGHIEKPNFSVEYLGVLSRMKKTPQPHSLDILALISGPEPQRTYFEESLKVELENSKKNVVMVRGVIEDEQKWTKHGNISIVNFMQSSELEEMINKSELIVSRSGYTTLLDLTILDKKVFFVPTPGQYEQEYLAKRLKGLGIAPYCPQNKFKAEKLNEAVVYQGLKPFKQPLVDFSRLFSLFQGK